MPFFEYTAGGSFNANFQNDHVEGPVTGDYSYTYNSLNAFSRC
jgi:hypothetical protein